MKKILLLITFVFVFFTANYAQGPADSGITGRVINKQSRKPFPNSKVTFTNQETGAFFETTTDTSGRFIKNELPPGNYKIIINAKGYENIEIKVKVYATQRVVLLPDPELSKKSKKGKRQKSVNKEGH